MDNEPLGKIDRKEQCRINQQAYRDRKKEKKNPPAIVEEALDSKDFIIAFLTKQNEELIKKNNDLHLQLMELYKTNSVQNISTKPKENSFNIQTFLSEDCKDSLNVTNFLDSIESNSDTFETVGNLGYVDGISKIVVDNLKKIDICKRPFQCTDTKRGTIYSKQTDVFVKEDDDNKIIRNFIKSIAHNTLIKGIPLFKAKYPDCGQSDSKHSDLYNRCKLQGVGGSNFDDMDSENKIIRKIIKDMTIHKCA